MKFYLSSFRIGNHGDKLVHLAGGGILAYIPNATDHISTEEQKKRRDRNLADLSELGISARTLDLKDFFSDSSGLKIELSKYSGVWISGGNTFVLRQAMKLSGFQKVLEELRSSHFLYSGYSAGVCVLAPHLRSIQIVDDPKKFPYVGQSETIWEGLNILDYMILPHYKSDHPESADIDKEVEYCKANKIPYRTLTDGDVLFGDNIEVIKRLPAFQT